MLWVVAGAVGTGYDFYITTKPYTWADVSLGIEGWSTDPEAVRIAVVLATVASLGLPIPLLIAGFVRSRGLRPRNWLRIAGWAGAWIAGFALIYQAEVWGEYPGNSPSIGSPAVVSWGELASRGSQCPQTRPDDAGLQPKFPQVSGSLPDPPDLPGHRVRAWGSRGRRFKSGRPDRSEASRMNQRLSKSQVKSHLFKPLRQVIESVNDTFKGQFDLERHGGHTPAGVMVRILQRILALTAAIWHNDKTGAPVHRSLTAYDH